MHIHPFLDWSASGPIYLVVSIYIYIGMYIYIEGYILIYRYICSVYVGAECGYNHLIAAIAWVLPEGDRH